MMTQREQMQDYLNRPYTCDGFQINEHVMYEKDGEIKDGYILCFRPFGYNWFAWIRPNLNVSIPLTSIYVGDLIKIEE